jgi:hypothetical protein
MAVRSSFITFIASSYPAVPHGSEAHQQASHNWELPAHRTPDSLDRMHLVLALHAVPAAPGHPVAQIERAKWSASWLQAGPSESNQECSGGMLVDVAQGCLKAICSSSFGLGAVDGCLLCCRSSCRSKSSRSGGCGHEANKQFATLSRTATAAKAVGHKCVALTALENNPTMTASDELHDFKLPR